MPNYPNKYQEYKNMDLPELAEARVNYIRDPSSIAQLVYEEKMVQKQNEYVKEQIELQHQKNIELVNRQLKWVKFSAVITASATILAALLGWYLGKENQELRTLLQRQIESRKTSEQQTKTSPSFPSKSSQSPPK